MRSRALYFTEPGRVEIREEEVPEPGEGEVLVATELSAVSAGTELLLYRGALEPGTVLDESLPALSGRLQYPVCYGYAATGRVIARGRSCTRDLEGRRVFAFVPHRSHFLAREEELHPVPEELSAGGVSFLPNVETAVSLVQDARPLLGERVLVVGQGVVGLLLTGILTRFPLGRLWSVEQFDARRRLSEQLGAERSLPPPELEEEDFDLSLEVSGTPDGLNLALGATGCEGRVVVGSWYGDRKAEIDLGTRFHRGRLTITSSQVSRLGAHLLSRWTKARRLQVAFDALASLSVEELVSHRFDIQEAAEAYRLLDEEPGACLQVLLTYT